MPEEGGRVRRRVPHKVSFESLSDHLQQDMRKINEELKKMYMAMAAHADAAAVCYP